MSSREESTERSCQICHIRNEPLVQLGDFVYLCSLCNSKRGQHWSFGEAWKYRYSHGYQSRSKRERSDRCYYCGSLNYLVDIFDRKHPNLMHRYQGHYECAYCKYDRTVVQPRHDEIMERSRLNPASTERYSLHTFRSEGAGSSGIDPVKALRRARADSEKRSREVERRRELYKELRERLHREEQEQRAREAKEREQQQQDRKEGQSAL